MNTTLLRSLQKVRLHPKANTKNGGITAIIKFKQSAFPISNSILKSSFFDVNDNRRLGHTSTRGGVYWERKTYFNNRVLIAIPHHLNPRKPITLVLFFHGNQSSLERDLIVRQKLVQQLFLSGANSILIAPQLAQDALDSSPGNFALNGFTKQFLAECADKISQLLNGDISKARLNKCKVVLAAYSGGYLPAVKCLAHGDIDKRVKGIILLDALYGEVEHFGKFVLNNARNIFFFSCFGEVASATNVQFAEFLSMNGKKTNQRMPHRLEKSKVTLLKLPSGLSHRNLLTQAWTKNPLADLLRKIAN